MLFESLVELVELLHFAASAPPQVAGACVTEIGPAERLQAAFEKKSACDFVGHSFILDEAVVARGADGLIIEAHRVTVPAIDTSEFGRYQGVLVRKGGRIVIGPFPKLLDVCAERLAPLALSFLRRFFEGCCDHKRGEVMVIEQLDATGRGPEQRLCLLCRCDGSFVVTRDESRLQF